MVKIHEEPDCGNAPRKEILRDFVLAVAERDNEHIASLLADDAVLTLVGKRTIIGRDAVRDWVTALPKVEAVEFGTFITHGRGASVDGVLHLVDGTRHGFCHVLRFTGAAKTAKIRALSSYIITVPTEN